VFLASMFRNLSIQGEDGFFLDTKSHQKQNILNKIYTDLIAGGIWPSGTKYSEISEWSFICRVRNIASLNDYLACEFIYFDYAGGRFTDMDEDDTELQEKIRSSDAILGLLDGQKILALMSNKSNDPKLNVFLNKELPAIIKWMSNHEVPVQFVISKWDLLESKFSLKEICNQLLEIFVFKEFVFERNKKGSPVRLIPISSVGTGFASPESDGSMRKNEGAVPCPFNVEAPISCVIPDRIKQDIIKNVKKEKNIYNQDVDKTGIAHKLLKNMLMLSPVIDLVVEGIVSIAMQEEDELAKLVANQFDNLVFSGVRRIVENHEKKLDELRNAKDLSLKNVQNETTALRSAVKSFLYIEEKLTRDFPDSEVILH